MLTSGKAHGPLELLPEDVAGRAGPGGHGSQWCEKGRQVLSISPAGCTGPEAPKRLNFHSLAPCLSECLVSNQSTTKLGCLSILDTCLGPPLESCL